MCRDFVLFILSASEFVSIGHVKWAVLVLKYIVIYRGFHLLPRTFPDPSSAASSFEPELCGVGAWCLELHNSGEFFV